MRTSAAFFISTCSAGQPSRNADRGAHQRLVAGQQDATPPSCARISSHASCGDASGDNARDALDFALVSKTSAAISAVSTARR